MSEAEPRFGPRRIWRFRVKMVSFIAQVARANSPGWFIPLLGNVLATDSPVDHTGRNTHLDLRAATAAAGFGDVPSWLAA